MSALDTLAPTRATDDPPHDRQPAEVPGPPADPQLDARPAPEGVGPNPFAVVGAALAAGVVLARWIDWKGHVRPRG